MRPRTRASDAPGSEALRQDTAALHDLASHGRRYAGVRLTASDVRLRTVSASRATIDATVDTSAYQLVGGGPVERRPAVQGQPLRLVLVWHDARWKVDSVLEASPPG